MKIKTKVQRKLGKREQRAINERFKQGKINTREYWEVKVNPYKVNPYTSWIMQIIKKYKVGADSYYIENGENKGRKEIITFHIEEDIWELIAQELER